MPVRDVTEAGPIGFAASIEPVRAAGVEGALTLLALLAAGAAMAVWTST